MEERRCHWRSCILDLYLFLAAIICFMQCDARKSTHLLAVPRHSKSSNVKTPREINMLKRVGINNDIPVLLDSSNTVPYVSSPFSLPPYEPIPPPPRSENAPPLCANPPFTPQPPSTTIPTPNSSSVPLLPSFNPPTSPMCTAQSPPSMLPTPSINVPTPTEPILSPPYYEPSPPNYTPSPTTTVPSPLVFVPGPPVFLPPVVYPPPVVPPPPYTAPSMGLWCVAKPSVPDPIIQEAMNYACEFGADCHQILPYGTCFQPDTVLAHASFAFNSYWQNNKVAGGTCEFGGSAVLVTEDPSYDGCHYIYN